MVLALTRFGRSNTKRSDSAHSVKLPQSGPPSCISSTSDVQTSSCHRPTSADQLWPVFLPLVSDAYHHNNNNSNKKPRRQLGQRMHHPDQISGPSARLPAASSSTSSLDSFSQDAQGDFFPLPQSSRFSKARFPFHSEDPVELVEGAAKAEDSVDGAQDSTRLHKNRSLEWITVPSQGRAPSKGICAHTATRVGNALYIIAGCDSKGCLGTLRRLDMTTLLWTRIKPKLKDASEKVPKLRAHTATRVHDSIVIYGGGNGPQYYGSIWIFNTKSEVWYKPTVQGDPPSPRRAHDAVLDAERNRICYFGGGNGRKALNDLAILDVSDPDLQTVKWLSMPSANKPPPPRGYHTFTQVDNSHAVLFGGSDGSVSYGDCHILDFNTLTWTQVQVDQQHYRMSHTSVVVGCKLFVLGGHDSTKYVDLTQVLEIDIRNGHSTMRSINGTSVPEARGYQTCNVHHDMIICIGGFDGAKLYDDTWALQLSFEDWVNRFDALPR